MQAIFSLAGKNRGIGVRVCDTKSGKKVAGKIRPRGAQGSIELNINSSLYFGKNSQLVQDQHCHQENIYKTKEKKRFVMDYATLQL